MGKRDNGQDEKDCHVYSRPDCKNNWLVFWGIEEPHVETYCVKCDGDYAYGDDGLSLLLIHHHQ